MALCSYEHFELISKISQKVLKLGSLKFNMLLEVWGTSMRKNTELLALCSFGHF